MSVPSNVVQAANALEAAYAKGAHSVRINTDLLALLLNGYALLSAAYNEIEKKTMEAENAE